MYSMIHYVIGTIVLLMASYHNSTPIAIQGLAIVIWASSENIREENKCMNT